MGKFESGSLTPFAPPVYCRATTLLRVALFRQRKENPDSGWKPCQFLLNCDFISPINPHCFINCRSHSTCRDSAGGGARAPEPPRAHQQRPCSSSAASNPVRRCPVIPVKSTVLWVNWGSDKSSLSKPDMKSPWSEEKDLSLFFFSKFFNVACIKKKKSKIINFKLLHTVQPH